MVHITNYANNTDYLYLFVGAVIIDVIVIFLTKYPGPSPVFKVKALDDWYNRFGATAAAADILSAMIGIAAARYIFTTSGFNPNNLAMFALTIVLFQLFHDALFYLAVIVPLPRGHNQMIDIFKDYAEENGGKILVADALILLGTLFFAMVLKSLPTHFTFFTGILSLYTLCFILYTSLSTT
jgi:hypothetical protein